ncbi:acyl-CoA synthetase (AMP-forming)/AMP-acid ligase II [Arthrobacter sp. UYEF20]
MAIVWDKAVQRVSQLPPGGGGAWRRAGEHPLLQSGAMNLPTATVQTWEKATGGYQGGWFRTGDIVSVDKDYFVTIRDRIKEMIFTRGLNV